MPARSPSYYSTRTRSRGRSPHTPHSRGRSRSRDSRYSDRSYYSDSFHSDDSRGRRRRSRSRTPPRAGGYAKAKYSGVKAGAKKPHNSKKPVKKSGAATSTPRPGGAQDVVTRRMLSARRLKINELRNEIDTLMKALEEIRQENKSLKRDNVLQNKQLDRFQDQEGELPHMLDSHSKEVRGLKEQIRKWRDRNDKANKTLRNAEDELYKSQKKIKHLQEISDDKKLEERDELSRRLGKAENELEERQHKVKQLEKHIENLEKSHRRKIVTEMKKHAATKLELETLHADLEYTKIHLRDREKELEVRNIYQNRIALAQRRGSISSLPALEPAARYQPPARSPDISPRHRAIQFEQKRRAEQKSKAKELTIHTFDSPNSATVVPPITSSKQSNQPDPQPQTQKQQKPKPTSDNARGTRRVVEKPDQSPTPRQFTHDPIKSVEPKPPATPKFETQDSWEAIVKKQQAISGPQATATNDSLDSSLTSSINKSRDDTFVKSQLSKSFFTTEIPEAENGLAEEQRAREREEDRKREQQRMENEQRKEEERREEKQRQLDLSREKHEREERERRAREERERYEREEQMRQKEEREEREREAQRAREADLRERRFREEADERARIAREQEKHRLQSDAKAAEERRKKDLLLQRMKEIDTGSSAPPPALGLSSKPSSFGHSAEVFGGDDGDFFLTSGDNANRAKEYNFRKTDENLFRGLPAKKQGDNKQPRGSQLFGDEGKRDNPLFSNKKDSLFGDDEDLDFGGYQPSSFGASSKQTGSRAKLTADEGDTWKVKDNGGAKKSDVLDDLFGGGTSKIQSSLFDDNHTSSLQQKASLSDKKAGLPWEIDTQQGAPNKILPRRPRADNATIHSKPTVRAIDDFDDDLEEVVL